MRRLFIVILLTLSVAAYADGRARYSKLTGDAISGAISVEANTKIIYPDDDASTAYAWLVSSSRDSQMGALSATNMRTLVLTPGLYTANTKIEMSSYTAIVGVGGVTIKLKTDFNDDLFVNADPNNTDITLSNLFIDGNKANQTAGGADTNHIIKFDTVTNADITDIDFLNYIDSGIVLDTCTKFDVRNVTDNGGGDEVGDGSILLVDCVNGTVTNVKTYECYYGVYVADSQVVRVRGIQTTGAKKDSLVTQILGGTAPADIIFEDCVITTPESSRFGTHCIGTSNLSIINCTFDRCDGCGVFIEDAAGTSEDVIVTGCTVKGTIHDGTRSIGILVNDTSGVVVSNNIVIDGEKDGIELAGCTDFVVSGNKCSGQDDSSNAGTGINIQGTTNDGVVSGNVCMDNRLAGIYLSAAGTTITDVIITGNRCGNRAGVRQLYGFYMIDSGTTSQLLTHGNNLTGNTAAGAIDAGSRLTLIDNIGFGTESVHITVTGIDATAVATTTLYTVPTGYTFYPTTVMIECTSWTAGQTFTASFGGNSATYDDFIDSQTFEFGAINTFLRDSPVNAVVTQAAADVFSISIEDDTTGTLVISVEVYGYLK